MKNTVLLVLAALCSLLIACQPPAAEAPAVDLNALKAEIQALEDGYAKATNEKDVEWIVGFYSEDAQRLPDGEPIEKGRDAIRKSTQEEMASDTSGATVSYQVLDVFADGNLLVEVGASVVKQKDGSTSNGKYIAVYEKRDGKWLCIRDIWNEDSDDDDGDDAED